MSDYTDDEHLLFSKDDDKKSQQRNDSDDDDDVPFSARIVKKDTTSTAAPAAKKKQPAKKKKEESSSAAKAQLMTIAESGVFDAIRGPGSISVVDGGGGTDIGPMQTYGVPQGGIMVLDPRATDRPNNMCREFQSAADFDPKRVAATASTSISSGYFWFHHSVADDMRVIDPWQLQQNAAHFAIWAMALSDLPDLLPRTGVPPTTTATPQGSQTPPSNQTVSPADASSDSSSTSSGFSFNLISFAIGCGAGVALCAVCLLVYWLATRRPAGRRAGAGSFIASSSDYSDAESMHGARMY
jgi:hypothetical protein